MRFLVLYRGTLAKFREAEFHSLVRLFRGREAENATLKPCGFVGGKLQSHLHGDVFQWADLRSEKEAKDVASRSVLIRAIFRVWGHGRTYRECLEDAIESGCDMEPILSDSTKTFKCVMEAFGRSYSLEEQLRRMHEFSPLLSKLKAKVRLKNPDYEVWIMEDVFPPNGHRHIVDKSGDPTQIFLALKIATGGQHVATNYSLKRRDYIGTTSMDAELAFLMANQALVTNKSILMDPFVGTGSILISAAAFGAHVIGSDIDMNVIRGKDNVGIRENFVQYNMSQPLAIVRGDILKTPWREMPWLDAIACDPPYGIREGSRSFREYDIPAEHTKNHIPATQRVRLANMFTHLLDFGARNLVIGGRLVFWLPTTQDYQERDLPRHPAFILISNTEQIITLRFRRRLITMEKVKKISGEELDTIYRELNDNVNTDSSHHNLAAKVLRQNHRKEDQL